LDTEEKSLLLGTGIPFPSKNLVYMYLFRSRDITNALLPVYLTLKRSQKAGIKDFLPFAIPSLEKLYTIYSELLMLLFRIY